MPEVGKDGVNQPSLNELAQVDGFALFYPPGDPMIPHPNIIHQYHFIADSLPIQSIMHLMHHEIRVDGEGNPNMFIDAPISRPDHDDDIFLLTALQTESVLYRRENDPLRIRSGFDEWVDSQELPPNQHVIAHFHNRPMPYPSASDIWVNAVETEELGRHPHALRFVLSDTKIVEYTAPDKGKVEEVCARITEKPEHMIYPSRDMDTPYLKKVYDATVQLAAEFLGVSFSDAREKVYALQDENTTEYTELSYHVASSLGCIVRTIDRNDEIGIHTFVSSLFPSSEIAR